MTTPIQYSRKTSVNDNEYDNDDNCNNNNNDKYISNGWIRMTTTMTQINVITKITTTTATTTIIINNNNNTIDSTCLLQLILHVMAL